MKLSTESTNRYSKVGIAIALMYALCGCASNKPRTDIVRFPPQPAPTRVVHLLSFNSIADLVPQRPTFTEMLRGGALRPFVGTPSGIAYRDSLLYVCDTGANVVHRWDLSTGNASTIGDGDSPLSKPVAVAVDELGRVYVSDTGKHEVVSFDVDGHYLRSYRADDCPVYRPVAVAVDSHQLYVADLSRHVIDVFQRESGLYEHSIGGPGSATGKLYYPMGIAIDADGDLFVSDMLNFRIQVFQPSGEFITAFGQAGDGYGDLGKPRQLDVAPDGTILIADPEFGRVHMFDDRGRLLLLIHAPGSGGGEPSPVGVAVARRLPIAITELVPEDFEAEYFIFVSHHAGDVRLSLFAVGKSR